MPQPLIQLVDAGKQFGDLSVLDGLDLSIEAGRTTTVIGQRGGGKSVLLHLMAGLMQPDSGRVLYKGRPLVKDGKIPGENGLPVISAIFRGATLFDSLTVFENIALPLRECKSLAAKEIRNRAADTIARLKLDSVSNKFPHHPARHCAP